MTMTSPDRSFWKGQRVCVTGGTGLLGIPIVRQLRALGARVRVLALPPHPRNPVGRMTDIDLQVGDIRDFSAVRSAIRDCDIVFHTAGIVAVWGPALKQVHAVHVDGTRHVLDAAVGRPTRVVLTSSVVTVGASLEPRPLDEDSPFPLDRLRVDYVQAKRSAERLALDRAAEGQDVVVVNPAYMVGPDDYERSVMGRFCTRYWRGLVPFAPPGGLSLVDVRDVATGHLLAAEHGRIGRRYILGGENRTFPEFMALLAEVAGFRPRAVPVVPAGVQAALARWAEARSRLTREHPYPSVQQARMSRHYWFFDSTRARQELGYNPRPLAESLAQTYEWYASFRDLRVRGLNRWWFRPGAPVPTVSEPADRSGWGDPVEITDAIPAQRD